MTLWSKCVINILYERTINFMSNLGINRAYIAGEIEKTPQEKQKELDEKMKEFLAKGGKVEKLPDMKPTKEQLKSWTI